VKIETISLANDLIKKIQETEKKIAGFKECADRTHTVRFYEKPKVNYHELFEITRDQKENPDFPTINDFFIFWLSVLEERKASLEKQLDDLQDI